MAVLVTDGQVPVPVPSARTVDVGQDVLVHLPEDEGSHVLNASAALVWRAIDGGADVGTIIDVVAAVVDLDPDVIADDVRRTIGDLRALGLIDQLPFAAVGSPSPWGATSGDERRADRIRALLRNVAWAGTTGPRQVAGTSVEIRTDEPRLADHFADVLSSLPSAPAAAHRISVLRREAGRADPYRILLDERPFARARSMGHAAERVLVEINQAAVHGTPGHLLFHAGAVARDGAVVVIAGESGRGKSTLTAALVQRGFTYLTDELVAVDPASRRVEPFPKALSLDDAALALLGVAAPERPVSTGDHLIPPGRLGAVSTGGALALLVLLTGDAVEPAAAPARPADHLVELLRNTFAPTFEVPHVLEALADICVHTPVLRLPRTDLDASAAAIAARVAEIVP